MVSSYGASWPGRQILADDQTSVVGEASTFHEFYRVEVDGVYRALALALGDGELAKEATHEGMIRAYQRWQRIGRYENPAGWVYRVALNWARSRIRKRKREVLTREVEPSKQLGPEPGEETDVDESIGEALAQLSIDHRSVVVLRHLLGWSTAETAEALGVAKGTVKSRLARALAEMEETLRATP